MSSVRSRRDSAGRLRVRHRVAVLSAVSCANVVCERLLERGHELAVLTHQHGCGQLGADMDLTRELLAGLAGHDNVAATLVVSLGCETNTADALVEAVRRKGGRADVVGIQSSGGVEAAIARAERRLRALSETALSGADVAPAEVHVGVVADRPTQTRQPGLEAEVVNALAERGFSILTATDLPLPQREASEPEGPLSVPARWRTRPRGGSDALTLLARPQSADRVSVALGANQVERMTVLTALGAHVIVCLAGQPDLSGSAISPTIKVATDERLDVLDDVIDVPFSGPDLPGRIVAAVQTALAGAPTRAELAGVRDLAIPRLGPNY